MFEGRWRDFAAALFLVRELRACGYPERVRVKLLYFGVLRDRFGTSDEALDLEDGATVGELLDRLRPRAPEDDRLWRSLAVAVNREYSGPDMVLRDGDEVALLPPVSGGCGAGVDESELGGASAPGGEPALRAARALLANECRRTSHQGGPYVD